VNTSIITWQRTWPGVSKRAAHRAFCEGAWTPAAAADDAEFPDVFLQRPVRNVRSKTRLARARMRCLSRKSLRARGCRAAKSDLLSQPEDLKQHVRFVIGIVSDFWGSTFKTESNYVDTFARGTAARCARHGI
jgi:hypothetical protein